MAECRYCAFARYGLHGSESLPHIAGCLLDLVVSPGPHDCPMFEREPGSDDDLGERPEIAPKASESAYTARSTSTRHDGVS